MKIDFSAVVKGLDGRPLKRNVRDDDGAEVLKDWTLGALSADALCAPIQSRDGPTIEGVSTRYSLAMQINAGGSQDIKPAQATLIQDAVAKAFPVLVAGPVIALLNGK